MKTPFKISFKKEIDEISNKIILEKFKVTFENSYCDHIKIVNNKELIVTNDFIRWKPDMNLNLWVGIKTAKITIDEIEKKKRKIIEYDVDFTRLIIRYFISFVLILVVFRQSGFWDNDSLKYLAIAIGIIGVLNYIVTYLRHWSIFKRTLKYGTEYLGNYDWSSILKSKTDLELLEIKNGKSQLPKSVIKLAEIELKKRKKLKNTD